jgi:eukaryotic-like serine/threonine-protein kinase
MWQQVSYAFHVTISERTAFAMPSFVGSGQCMRVPCINALYSEMTSRHWRQVCYAPLGLVKRNALTALTEMSLPTVGQIWDEKYRIDRVLGEGGMGVVFEAYHLRLEQQVAIKCLLPALADNSAVRARFEREARAAARLRSRHVVKILDVETHPTSNVPYMVMELMHGRDLENEVLVRGELPYAELCNWLVQVAGALAEAHHAGIVHRDIKPSNIFLAEEPGDRVAKVLDFGIAKSSVIVPGITYNVEGGSAICGTPIYMSPEQITDSDIDGRSDVWSLGVVTYEMLSGQSPFVSQSFTALAVKIANETPRTLNSLRPDLPKRLCDIVMQTLEKSRANRLTMTELAEALAPFGNRSDLMRWNQPRASLASIASLPDVPSAPNLSVRARAPAQTLLGQTLPYVPGTSKSKVAIGIGFGVVALSLGGIAAFATHSKTTVPTITATAAPIAPDTIATLAPNPPTKTPTIESVVSAKAVAPTSSPTDGRGVGVKNGVPVYKGGNVTPRPSASVTAVHTASTQTTANPAKSPDLL